MLKQIVFIILFAITSVADSRGQINEPPEKKFAVAQLKADLIELKTNLENKHPNLYLYTTKIKIDSTFDSLLKTITAPLTEIEFYKHVSILCSLIKDGHTVILPSEEITNNINNKALYLPFHAIIINNKLYMDMLYSIENSIPVGSEILRINDMASDEILTQLMDRQVRDGYNLSYPTWILSNYFRQYYRFVFGYSKIYNIEYKINAQIHTASLRGLTTDSINFYRAKHYPDKVFTKRPHDGLLLKMDQDKKYAVLTIKDFHNNVLKSEYKQNFKKEISSYFEQIQLNHIENLILDLRNNQGGDIENGVLILSYLLDKPFSVVQSYNKLKNNQLTPCKGPALGFHQPTKNNFKGQLYVLINGGSFSNSGIVASCLQKNKRATFIGQETGGNPNVIAGFINELKLPNSKIQVQIPTKQFMLTDSESPEGHGVLPTFILEPTLSDILQNIDKEINYTLDLIRKN